MLDTARSIVGRAKGLSRADFDADENLCLALVHLVQTFGEAARRVSPEFQGAHPEIPWKKIIGMRHKVVHDYLHVDYQTVWEVATLNLPPLIVELEKLLPEDNPGKENLS
jgi:uncharacterized protein with HEPN domain